MTIIKKEKNKIKSKMNVKKKSFYQEGFIFYTEKGERFKDYPHNKSPVGKSQLSQIYKYKKKSNPKKRKKVVIGSNKQNVFTIQVGSYNLKKEAILHLEKLRDLDLSPWIMVKTLNLDEVWYRVRVGEFNSYKQALGFMQSEEIKNIYDDAFILKILLPVSSSSYHRVESRKRGSLQE
ncbi:MAG: SPOR domain-containing protein [Bacteriovoracaceae bacterium]|nr:SPOR domain-containing protein [Bacteriovoracaceae bacterium]